MSKMLRNTLVDINNVDIRKHLQIHFHLEIEQTSVTFPYVSVAYTADEVQYKWLGGKRLAQVLMF